MIQFATCTPTAAAAPVSAPAAVVLNPNSGPGRAACPVASMARDLQDIVAVRGGAEIEDLVARGWLPEEIERHRVQALGYMRAHAL